MKAKTLKNKDQRKALRREVLRKLIHLLEIPVLLAYTLIASLYGSKPAILVLTALLIILLEIEYIRLEYKFKLPQVIDILRRHEKDNIASNIFFIASTIICFAAFDYPIALLALLLTVFGDLMSALVGIRFGKTRIYKKKTLEGFVAGVITNILIGHLVIPGNWLLVLPMAIIASVVELWTGKLDDNLTVPLAAGFTGQVLVLIGLASLNGYPGPILSWLAGIVGLVI